MRIFVALILVVLGFIAFVVLSDFGSLWYQQLTAPFRGKTEAERQIESGSSRIQHYQEFFKLCQGIQAKEAQIDALESNVEMDRAQKANAITAAKIARQSLISEYNSKTAQDYTAARFKDVDLPYSIPLTSYSGQKTKCAN